MCTQQWQSYKWRSQFQIIMFGGQRADDLFCIRTVHTVNLLKILFLFYFFKINERWKADANILQRRLCLSGLEEAWARRRAWRWMNEQRERWSRTTANRFGTAESVPMCQNLWKYSASARTQLEEQSVQGASGAAQGVPMRYARWLDKDWLWGC